MKIWGRANSVNVQKVLWLADECGLAYERLDVGGPFGGNDQPWYLAMNPNGVVPTVEEAGRILWESNAILRYLAARYAPGTLWPLDPGERSEAERWMDWQLGTLHAGMRAIYWGLVRTPAREHDTGAIAAGPRCGWLMKLIVGRRQARSRRPAETPLSGVRTMHPQRWKT